MAKSNSQLKSEYDEQKAELDKKYSSLAERETQNLVAEKAEEAKNAEAELRSKYVAERSALRSLPQVASAAGLSGGGVKNAFRSSAAAYGTARDKIISERDFAVRKLLTEYAQSGEKNSEAYAEKLSALRRRYYSVLGTSNRYW